MLAMRQRGVTPSSVYLGLQGLGPNKSKDPDNMAVIVSRLAHVSFLVWPLSKTCKCLCLQLKRVLGELLVLCIPPDSCIADHQLRDGALRVPNLA